MDAGRPGIVLIIVANSCTVLASPSTYIFASGSPSASVFRTVVKAAPNGA